MTARHHCDRTNSIRYLLTLMAIKASRNLAWIAKRERAIMSRLASATN